MSPKSPQQVSGVVPDTVPDTAKVQRWVVDGEYEGQRIDNYLMARLKGVPKTRIHRMVRTGEVRVNGGRVGSDYRVQAGDQLRIPPVRVAQGTAGDGRAQSTGGASLAMAKAVTAKIKVVLEDEIMLAIDKPFGLAVHGGSGVKLGVIEALRASLRGDGSPRALSSPRDDDKTPSLRGSARPEAIQDLGSPRPFGPRDDVYLELVHRLDRETSGVMLIAKRRSALTEFHRQLREGEMRKRYLALVWGDWPVGLDQIDAPLHKWVNAKGERWVRVDPEGQVAITKVKVLQRAQHPEFGNVSLLECEPITGRTHQLRVHLASQGCPILGDSKYGDYTRDGVLKPKRMMLHAWQLRCKHPRSEEKLHLRAEPDSQWIQLTNFFELESP
jgi:23S rRNA pseudouridine955/2504/2580 synthase